MGNFLRCNLLVKCLFVFLSVVKKALYGLVEATRKGFTNYYREFIIAHGSSEFAAKGTVNQLYNLILCDMISNHLIKLVISPRKLYPSYSRTI